MHLTTNHSLLQGVTVIASTFCLLLSACRPPVIIIPPDISDGGEYMELNDEITTAYRRVNDTLAFVYEEEYNANALQYRIYANDGSVLYSNADQAVTIHYGRNYVRLLFSSSSPPFSSWPDKNPLLLEVTNAKQRHQYLTFNYSRS